MYNYKDVLLAPEDIVIAIIDEEPQMFFGVEGFNRAQIMNNVVGLAKAAKIFNVPVILSTVQAKEFSGPMYSKLQEVYPNQTPIDRTTLNSWEDENFKAAVMATGRKKLIIAGLWTEVCVALPALCAKRDGYDVYFVSDACGGSSKDAHDMAVQRMIQAGVKPLTWQALLLELQRDWANSATYTPVTNLIQQVGGVYGLGLEYANEMIPKN
ncbi:MAG: hydrolase [Clostridioides sp.]|jgi:nicotinamidase-related amidase|nr:hydrolase [Clostridioides sp.]